MSHAVAVCDVDANHLANAVKNCNDQGREVAAYGDFRQLIENDDVDIVVVCTPDHWHALTTIAACQAKKHVYCEKPLSLTISDGRHMVAAARENGCIVQTGSQQRSSGNFRRACELVRNGAIGELEAVLVGIAGANHPGELPPDSMPPEHLDYDMWLGPAPLRPYNEKRVHYNFRFWWDYSGGQMTNWGAHHIDIGQWGMGTDDTGPISSEGTGRFNPHGYHEVTEGCRVTHTYANGVTMIVGQGESDVPGGTTFVGTGGRIHVNRGHLSSDPGDILEFEIPEDGVHLIESRGHHRNFLDCVRSGDLPICDVEIGHRSSSICHLGNIAIRTGQKIEWDPANEVCTNSTEEIDRLINKPYRDPWTL